MGKVRFFLVLLLVLTNCTVGTSQIVDRVLDTYTESWVESRQGEDTFYREKIHIVLYLDRDILKIGDDRYDIIRDIGPTRDIRDTLILRFEALDKNIKRVRVVFLTGHFVNQIQIIYSDRVYKYNLKQYW